MLFVHLVDDEPSGQGVVVPPAAEPLGREDLLLSLNDLAHRVQLQVHSQLKEGTVQCLSDIEIQDLPDIMTTFWIGKSVIAAVTVSHQVFLHDCLLEEGQSSLVSEDILDGDFALAIMAERWPASGKM